MSEFREAVGEAFCNVMRVRHPECRWKLVSEDEGRERLRSAPRQHDVVSVAVEEHADSVLDRSASAA